jgi:RNA polymerase sigma-70 factor (ECF subfamily)
MRNQQEFTELLETNLPAVRRFVLGMVRNHSDADDIVQDTALKAFTHFAGFRAEAKFRTWITSIARNEVLTQRSRGSTSRVSYVELHQLEQMASAGSADSPYCLYQQNEYSRKLENAMASLRPSERAVIRLRALEGRNVAETARELSISSTAMRTRFHRAIRHLSAALTGPPGTL